MIPDKLWLVIQLVATLMAILALICRMGRMTPETPAHMRWQHAVLLAGLVGTLVLPPLAGKAALSMAVMCWLALSAHRWRHGAPRDRPPMVVAPLERPSDL